MRRRTFWTALTDRPERIYPPMGGFVPVEGGVVHYLADGPAGGLPVVLLHGASGNLRDFSMRLLPLLARRHRVIALDRPGFGHSPALPGVVELDGQVRVLRAALRRLGHGRVCLLGHSFGGALALAWALRHPEDVAGLLVLSGAAMDWGGGLGPLYRWGGAPLLRQIASHVARAVPERVIAATLNELFHPDPVPPRYREEGGIELALRPRTFRTNFAAMNRLHAQIVGMQPRYGQILCPVEIVHGVEDRVVPAEIHAKPLARLLPRAELTLMPGTGHMPHHTRAAEVSAAVDRLLARVRAAG
jgi:pimeloyl-ACP methyl ester carboxylesterase